MESLDLELTDEDAVETAIEMLESVKFNSGVKNVKITVSGMGGPAPTTGTEENTTDDSGVIRPNTSHHTIIYHISMLTGDGNTATTRRIIDAIDSYSEGTIRPSLGELRDRGLVVRENIGDENTHYAYELTEAGEKILNEFGNPE